MYISIQELVLFIVFCLVAVGAIYLIITLNNFNKVLVEAKQMINYNKANIQQTVENLTHASADIKEITASIRKGKHIFDEDIPDTIANIHSISETLKNTSENADHSIEIINSSLIETATTVRENTQDLITYAKLISEVLSLITQALFPKKNNN